VKNDGHPAYTEAPPAAPSPVNSAPSLRPDAVNSSLVHGGKAVHTNTEPNKVDPALSEKLNHALAALPKYLQQTFVERMVENLTNPEAYRKHVEAVSVLATAAAIEAENQTMISNANAQPTTPGVATNHHPEKLSMENHSDMTLPVAAAALGAFLAKYGNATGDKGGKNEYHPPNQ